ncbi:uncharacterized protein LOC101860840 [Aplysia californica]|uniref:Uncharacterized protein LOC101860840 n=1 Tax=Aplysia californica TaxID=6500 RepID=A0ABM0K1T0_APLCA|nr:uncharacterized protein LOC101860840 [Aplysia californica]
MLQPMACMAGLNIFISHVVLACLCEVIVQLALTGVPQKLSSSELKRPASETVPEEESKAPSSGRPRNSGSDSLLGDSCGSGNGSSPTPRESQSEHTGASNSSEERQDRDSKEKESNTKPWDKDAQKPRGRDREVSKRKRDRDDRQPSGERKGGLRNATGDMKVSSTGQTNGNNPEWPSEIKGYDVKSTCRLEYQTSLSAEAEGNFGSLRFSDRSSSDESQNIEDTEWRPPDDVEPDPCRVASNSRFGKRTSFHRQKQSSASHKTTEYADGEDNDEKLEKKADEEHEEEENIIIGPNFHPQAGDSFDKYLEAFKQCNNESDSNLSPSKKEKDCSSGEGLGDCCLNLFSPNCRGPKMTTRLNVRNSLNSASCGAILESGPHDESFNHPSEFAVEDPVGYQAVNNPQGPASSQESVSQSSTSHFPKSPPLESQSTSSQEPELQGTFLMSGKQACRKKSVKENDGSDHSSDENDEDPKERNRTYRAYGKYGDPSSPIASSGRQQNNSPMSSDQQHNFQCASLDETYAQPALVPGLCHNDEASETELSKSPEHNFDITTLSTQETSSTESDSHNEPETEQCAEVEVFVMQDMVTSPLNNLSPGSDSFHSGASAFVTVPSDPESENGQPCVQGYHPSNSDQELTSYRSAVEGSCSIVPDVFTNVPGDIEPPFKEACKDHLTGVSHRSTESPDHRKKTQARIQANSDAETEPVDIVNVSGVPGGRYNFQNAEEKKVEEESLKTPEEHLYTGEPVQNGEDVKMSASSQTVPEINCFSQVDISGHETRENKIESEQQNPAVFDTGEEGDVEHLKNFKEEKKERRQRSAMLSESGCGEHIVATSSKKELEHYTIGTEELRVPAETVTQMEVQAIGRNVVATEKECKTQDDVTSKEKEMSTLERSESEHEKWIIIKDEKSATNIQLSQEEKQSTELITATVTADPIFEPQGKQSERHMSENVSPIIQKDHSQAACECTDELSGRQDILLNGGIQEKSPETEITVATPKETSKLIVRLKAEKKDEYGLQKSERIEVRSCSSPVEMYCFNEDRILCKVANSDSSLSSCGERDKSSYVDFADFVSGENIFFREEGLIESNKTQSSPVDLYTSDDRIHFTITQTSEFSSFEEKTSASPIDTYCSKNDLKVHKMEHFKSSTESKKEESLVNATVGERERPFLDNEEGTRSSGVEYTETGNIPILGQKLINKPNENRPSQTNIYLEDDFSDDSSCSWKEKNIKLDKQIPDECKLIERTCASPLDDYIYDNENACEVVNSTSTIERFGEKDRSSLGEIGDHADESTFTIGEEEGKPVDETLSSPVHVYFSNDNILCEGHRIVSRGLIEPSTNQIYPPETGVLGELIKSQSSPVDPYQSKDIYSAAKCLRGQEDTYAAIEEVCPEKHGFESITSVPSMDSYMYRNDYPCKGDDSNSMMGCSGENGRLSHGSPVATVRDEVILYGEEGQRNVNGTLTSPVEAFLDYRVDQGKDRKSDAQSTKIGNNLAESSVSTTESNQGSYSEKDFETDEPSKAQDKDQENENTKQVSKSELKARELAGSERFNIFSTPPDLPFENGSTGKGETKSCETNWYKPTAKAPDSPDISRVIMQTSTINTEKGNIESSKKSVNSVSVEGKLDNEPSNLNTDDFDALEEFSLSSHGYRGYIGSWADESPDPALDDDDSFVIDGQYSAQEVNDSSTTEPESGCKATGFESSGRKGESLLRTEVAQEEYIEIKDSSLKNITHVPVLSVEVTREFPRNNGESWCTKIEENPIEDMLPNTSPPIECLELTGAGDKVNKEEEPIEASEQREFSQKGKHYILPKDEFEENVKSLEVLRKYVQGNKERKDEAIRKVDVNDTDCHEPLCCSSKSLGIYENPSGTPVEQKQFDLGNQTEEGGAEKTFNSDEREREPMSDTSEDRDHTQEVNTIREEIVLQPTLIDDSENRYSQPQNEGDLSLWTTDPENSLNSKRETQTKDSTLCHEEWAKNPVCESSIEDYAAEWEFLEPSPEHNPQVRNELDSQWILNSGGRLEAGSVVPDRLNNEYWSEFGYWKPELIGDMELVEGAVASEYNDAELSPSPTPFGGQAYATDFRESSPPVIDFMHVTCATTKSISGDMDVLEDSDKDTNKIVHAQYMPREASPLVEMPSLISEENDTPGISGEYSQIQFQGGTAMAQISTSQSEKPDYGGARPKIRSLTTAKAHGGKSRHHESKRKTSSGVSQNEELGTPCVEYFGTPSEENIGVLGGLEIDIHNSVIPTQEGDQRNGSPICWALKDARVENLTHDLETNIGTETEGNENEGEVTDIISTEQIHDADTIVAVPFDGAEGNEDLCIGDDEDNAILGEKSFVNLRPTRSSPAPLSSRRIRVVDVEDFPADLPCIYYPDGERAGQMVESFLTVDNTVEAQCTGEHQTMNHLPGTDPRKTGLWRKMKKCLAPQALNRRRARMRQPKSHKKDVLTLPGSLMDACQKKVPVTAWQRLGPSPRPARPTWRGSTKRNHGLGKLRRLHVFRQSAETISGPAPAMRKHRMGGGGNVLRMTAETNAQRSPPTTAGASRKRKKNRKSSDSALVENVQDLPILGPAEQADDPMHGVFEVYCDDISTGSSPPRVSRTPTGTLRSNVSASKTYRQLFQGEDSQHPRSSAKRWLCRLM